MNKIADYFGVHYTLVSLTIERLAEKYMIARLDPEFALIARLDPEFAHLFKGDFAVDFIYIKIHSVRCD
tara:strand:- start:2671 stop:2877 length:207 start_codon:yes stop_codon:yes gene_type:complete